MPNPTEHGQPEDCLCGWTAETGVRTSIYCPAHDGQGQSVGQRCLTWLDGHSHRKCLRRLGHEGAHQEYPDRCGVPLPDDDEGLACSLPFDHEDRHETARIVRWEAS